MTLRADTTGLVGSSPTVLIGGRPCQVTSIIKTYPAGVFAAGNVGGSAEPVTGPEESAALRCVTPSGRGLYNDVVVVAQTVSTQSPYITKRSDGWGDIVATAVDEVSCPSTGSRNFKFG